MTQLSESKTWSVAAIGNPPREPPGAGPRAAGIDGELRVAAATDTRLGRIRDDLEGGSCVILSERSESKDLLQLSEVETRSVASVGTADSPRSE